MSGSINTLATDLRNTSKSGFTIVELLIVVVVIAILAAITIVAYNGIQQRAQTSSLQTTVSQAARKIEVYKVQNGSYPADIATAGVTLNADYTGVYVPSADMSSYCFSAATATMSFSANHNDASAKQGGCVTRTNLVGEWTFNGNANDSSGNGMNGTVSGATLTTGQNGQANSAYSFNGTSNYISLASSTPLNFTTQNFTVSVWVNLPTLPLTGAWYDVLSSTGGGDWSMGVNATAAGVGRLMMTKISQVDSPTGPTVDQNTWKLLTATYTYGAGPIAAVNYYIDGTLASTVTWNHGGYGNFAPSTKRIGSRASSGYYRGAMDDLRVYSRTLSAAEIRSLYAAGAQ